MTTSTSSAIVISPLPQPHGWGFHINIEIHVNLSRHFLCEYVNRDEHFPVAQIGIILETNK